MEDLLAKHADRIEVANAEMTDAGRIIVEKATADARAAILAFGQELIGATRTIDDALATVKAALQAAMDAAQAELAGAFIDNVSALAASANSMNEEVAQRTRFLATGELPVRETPMETPPEQARAAEMGANAPPHQGEGPPADHRPQATE